MKKPKIVFITSVIFIVLLCTGLYFFFVMGVTASQQAERLFRAAYKKSTVPIKFYGQVLDQDSKPIKDAKVSVEVTYYNPKGEFWESERTRNLVTDTDGKFELKDKGRLIFVKVIKDGYEILSNDFPRERYRLRSTPSKSYNYDPSRGDAYTPNKENPEIFYLRKKAYPAFLVGTAPLAYNQKPDHINIKSEAEENISIGCYIVYPWVAADGSVGRLPRNEHLKGWQSRRDGEKDLLIECFLSSDTSLYNVEFKPLIPNSGILVSDQLLFKAPDSGYQSSVQFSVPRGTTTKKFVYFVLDDNKFYGRLDVEIDIDPPGRRDPTNRITMDTWINPTGSRNLEYDSAFQFEEVQWRQMLQEFHGQDARTLNDSDPRDVHLIKDFGLKQLPKFENPEQFFTALRKLRAEKNNKNPRWWHKLEEEETEDAWEESKSHESDIVFYGKALDTDLNPIQNEEFEVDIVYADINALYYKATKTIKIQTDSSGIFSIHDRGEKLIIKPIENWIYQYADTKKKIKEYSFSPRNLSRHVPNKTNPVIFIFSKKSKPAYVLGTGPNPNKPSKVLFAEMRQEEMSTGIGLIPNGNWYYSDGRRGEASHIRGSDLFQSQNEIDNPYHYDIQVIAKKCHTPGYLYELIFKICRNNSGLLVLHDKLQQAPNSGYEEEVSFLIPDKEPEKGINPENEYIYVYGKFLDGKYFVRLDLAIKEYNPTQNRLRVTYDTWVSPDASPSFVYDQEYQDYEDKWRKQLIDLRNTAKRHTGELRTFHSQLNFLDIIIGVKPDGTFDEALFQQEADALKAQLKKKDPRWWDSLEETEK